MPAHSLPARLLFRLRHFNVMARVRTIWLRLCGVKIGKYTVVPKISITWPHQVQIGANCILEPDIYFKFDGICCPGPSIIIGDNAFVGRGCEFNIREKITIGQGCAIASGCKFIDHEHGIRGARIDETPGEEAEITIGPNTLIGCNAVILKGVSIGESALVAAGAVVTKNIPPGEIWAGVPAARISIRNS